MKELDISRCSKITDAGLEHILSISNLERLCISETRVTSKGIIRLSSLVNLRSLDLGGLPVTDQAIDSLKVSLFLWGVGGWFDLLLLVYFTFSVEFTAI